MQPTLADLDTSRLSDDALDALQAGNEIADGASMADVAGKRNITLEELKLRLDKLAAEWRQQSGAIALPKLPDDEYEALRESIRTRGQLVPIICDAAGNIVDGRHRARACRELNIEPRIDFLPDGTSSDELKSLALVVNLARRQLTTGARRGIVRDELLRDATRSDRAIAAMVGVSPTTVGSVRKELEQSGAVSNLDTRVGQNGVAQPAAKPPREPATKPELPDGRIDVTLRIDKLIAAQLDGAKWVDCKAFRLVLIDAGTYSLEVRT